VSVLSKIEIPPDLPRSPKIPKGLSVDTPYIHGMLDPKWIGKPEDCLKKYPVKLLGREFEVYDLSQPFGYDVPLWPYFEDPIFERIHYHSKSRVLTRRIVTVMHVATHIDAPIHVEEGFPSIDQIPIGNFIGEGVVISIPKGKWEFITVEELEKAEPPIQPGDFVIINTGWHKYWGDNVKYYCYGPGLSIEAAWWLVQKGVRLVGIDTQALDHPLYTRQIWSQGPGTPDERNIVVPWLVEEYKKTFGRDPREDFPYWEPVHRILLTHGIIGIENVGGEVDKVSGKRCIIIALPLKWIGGDGSMTRLVALVEKK
jgi:kynurenine formamidase